MIVFLWFVVLVVSLAVLVKAADKFTDYAEKFGKFLKLPNFIIGVLILAVGTSLPELATSIMGVRQGEVEFLSGNVIGTVVVNMLLGLGIAVLFTKKKAKFNWDIIDNDLPFFAASIFLVVIALFDGVFSMVEAIIFLAGYIIYVIYAYQIQKDEKESAKKELKEQLKEEIKQDNGEAKTGLFLKKIFSPEAKTLFFMLIALAFVVLASKYVVDSVIVLADIFGLGTSVIAATAVALGTSLPEILVAISAARRGNFDMVIGDILGSNIFDIFVIYGVCGLFTTLTISMELDMTLIPFLVGTFFLLWLVLIDKKITKTEGLLFVLIYVMFLGKLFKIF